jgi:hypothetical protein
MVSANPSGPDADQARAFLARLPKTGTSDMQPAPAPRSLTDDQAGVASGPLESRALSIAGGKPIAGLPGAPRDVTAQAPHHIQTELEGDPIAQEIVGQAALMGPLHLLSGGASYLGRKLMQTEGGQAAKYLAQRGLPLEAPPRPFGAPPPVAGAASSEQEVMRARDALKFKAPHVGDLGVGGAGAAALLHAGHAGLAGLPGLAALAARNAAPIAGRLAMPLIRAGEVGAAASPAMSLAGNPLLEAAVGGK